MTVNEESITGFWEIMMRIYHNVLTFQLKPQCDLGVRMYSVVSLS